MFRGTTAGKHAMASGRCAILDERQPPGGKRVMETRQASALTFLSPAALDLICWKSNFSGSSAAGDYPG